MLGICEYFRTKEANYMIGDHLDGLVTEVCVIDAEVRVEPLDFACDELPRDEALFREKKRLGVVIRVLYE